MTAYINEFSLKFTLRSATTALLVVDMQNATGSLQHGLAKMLHEQGRLEESRYRFERIQNFVVPNTQKLLAAFRALGAPVIFITYGAETPDCSDVARHIRAFVQATGNKVGKAEHDIVDALKPLPQEPSTRRHRACGRRCVHEQLRRHDGDGSRRQRLWRGVGL